jgi:mono/diheme cytochrome c family protein
MLPALLTASTAYAADAGSGRRVAEMRCVPCHAVLPNQRKDIDEAPPFDAVARKYASSPDTLTFAMRDPHPRMNVTLTRREMEDIAAYINTLAK